MNNYKFLMGVQSSQFLLVVLLLILLPNSIISMNKKPPPEIKEYPGFGRECTDGCTFIPNGEGNGTLYFSCKLAGDKSKSFCFCSTGTFKYYFYKNMKFCYICDF